MWQELLRAIPVYFSSMFKFIFGPLGGYAANLNLITTILTTVAGMMTVVFLLTFFGNWIRTKVFGRFKKRKINLARAQKLERLWKRFGLIGVAFLTPIFLTPIGGTLLAVSSGSPKEKIIIYMFISASVWAVIFSVAVYFFGNEVIPDVFKPDKPPPITL
jgi:membrane protein DedA with SNARE-associated domain